MLQQATAYLATALRADDDNLVRSMRQFIYSRMQVLGDHFHMKFWPTGSRDKRARAASLEGLVHLNRIKVVQADWNEQLITELCEFPVGPHDDMVDCLSLVARHLLDIGRGPRDADPAPPHEAPGRIIERDGQLYTRSSLDELWGDHDRNARGRGRIV